MSMSEATIQFPVICPDCRKETLITRPLKTVTAALITRTNTLPLYAPCHARRWTATEEELQQIREYLGAWLTASASEPIADDRYRQA
jgi:hypothetical protein